MTHATRVPSTAELLDVIGGFYDAALDPALWPASLGKLAALMQGAAAAISLHDTSDNSVRVDAKYNIGGDFERAMTVNVAINPCVPSVWYADVDAPYSAADAVGDEEMRNSLWYRRTVGPAGYHDAALSVLVRSASRFGALSIIRRAELPNFAEPELAIMRLVSPHVRRAVSIADMLDTRTLARDTLAATLDRLALGIVLADGDGRIAHANEAANRYLEAGDALRRLDGRLAARDATSAHALSQALSEAASGTTISVPRSGIVVVLKGHAGRDLAAWVLPLDGGLRRELGAGFAARAAVFVRELGDTAPFPAELFVRRYAITPAESRVMVLLVQGMSVAEAAETLGITQPTARTHLARLFEKTGTSRQADLVRLAMSALAPTAAGPR